MALLATLDYYLGYFDLVLSARVTAQLHLVRVLLAEERVALAQSLEGQPTVERLMVGLWRVFRVVALFLQNSSVASLEQKWNATSFSQP